jgi:hypothetical protein
MPNPVLANHQGYEALNQLEKAVAGLTYAHSHYQI